MAYKCTFMDDAEYTASDVNEVFSKLTGEGVVIFNDSGCITDDLNSAVAEFTSEGVTENPESCLVTKSGEEYIISEGSCIMPDGSMIIFSDGGEVIKPISESLCYVYLRRNLLANTIDIIVSEDMWTEGDVPLARIEENGTVTDMRIYSQCKCAPSGQNISASARIKGTMEMDGSIEVDMGFLGFKYIIFDIVACVEAIDLSDGEGHMMRCTNAYSSYYFMVQKQGSKLKFYPKAGNSGSFTYDVTFEVR